MLGAAGAGVQDGQAERLWSAAGSHKLILHALTWDEFRDPLGQNLAADVDVLLTRIGYKAEALVGVEPTNFTDWHVASPFFSSLPWRAVRFFPRGSTRRGADAAGSVRTVNVRTRPVLSLQDTRFGAHPWATEEAEISRPPQRVHNP